MNSKTIDKPDQAPKRSELASGRTELALGTMSPLTNLDRLEGPLRTNSGTFQDQAKAPSQELAPHVRAMIQDMREIIQKVDEFQLQIRLAWKRNQTKSHEGDQ